MTNKSNYYVTNGELLPEIIKYKESGIMSEELGIMITDIAQNYSKKGSFFGYTWRDDMISEAILTCVKYLHNFNPDKQKTPNPFAYITIICHRAFVNYIKKQKRHSSIKDICYKNEYMLEKEDTYIKGIDYTILKD